jgi:anionic cell wall polymer biosynthesis LytR-Cps2A-Psr (LCP) family protein
VRASRQRAVLSAMIEKLRATKNPVVYARLMQTVFSTVKTNVNAFEIGLEAVKVLTGGLSVEQFRLPAEGAYTTGTVDGAWVIKPDLEKNRKLLNAFLQDSAS